MNCEYTLWRNGKLQGTYDENEKRKAMDAWDKLVGYAMAPTWFA